MSEKCMANVVAIILAVMGLVGCVRQPAAAVTTPSRPIYDGAHPIYTDPGF